MIYARANNGQLGDVYDDASALIARGPEFIHQAIQIVDKVWPYLPTVKLVLDDPALQQVVSRVQVIRGLEVASAGGNSSSVKGIGLKRALPVLDAYIWYRKNPWVPWAALGVGAFVILAALQRRK